MPMMNIALGLKVASALFLMFTVLTALHIAGHERQDSEATGQEESSNREEAT